MPALPKAKVSGWRRTDRVCSRFGTEPGVFHSHADCCNLLRMNQHRNPVEHEHQKLTPPEVARLFRVSNSKVLTWIRNGELRAVNVATRMGGFRPRYRIDREDIAAFERWRQVIPPPPKTRRSDRRWLKKVTQYV